MKFATPQSGVAVAPVSTSVPTQVARPARRPPERSTQATSAGLPPWRSAIRRVWEAVRSVFSQARTEPGRGFGLALLLAAAASVRGATTINPTHAHAWGANVGWINWRADGANGAIIGEFFCSGHLYGANVGWINLGNGTPANQRQYQNNSASDFGVNLDVQGNLRGLAYGANVGWLVFEDKGAPKVDLRTGRLSGFIYGANVGWISLSNAVAFVQTDQLAPAADSDADGLPDAWELNYTSNLVALTGTGDRDGDGLTDAQEYQADTSPVDARDALRITSFEVSSDRARVSLAWTTKATRQYQLQHRESLAPATGWTNTLRPLEPDAGGTTTRTLEVPPARAGFFRVLAIRPLAP